ncbi:hypothetical protein [Magnetospirillum fulvum]|uniref:Uncharacterized protein n=1 Tax=Magnetospirillum fulvum TaxID=1082 RepID=A0A1H6JE24_MAGFU|nr:hypothetical protein [Magnetospirillum fulvum]SEH60481.1 hypothetical protein SAMN04244559_03135 [Magnetospirillum fulvum]
MEAKTVQRMRLPVLIGLFLVSDAVLAPPAARAEDTCVEVEIGGEKTPNLSCLNQSLRRKAAEVRPLDTAPPLDAASPSVKTGGFNLPALKQQYGPNFGKSAQPYRPTQTYPSPTSGK